MKKIDFCKIGFILACLGFFLPWFSHNPKMTGYLWGIHYIHYFILPMFFISLYVFSRKKADWVKVPAIVSAFLNVPLLVIAWGRFNIVRNVSGKWSFDTRVLRFGFFIALGLFVLLLASVTIKAFKKNENLTVEEKTK